MRTGERANIFFIRGIMYHTVRAQQCSCGQFCKSSSWGSRLTRHCVLISQVYGVAVRVRRHDELPEDDVLTSKHVGANLM